MERQGGAARFAKAGARLAKARGGFRQTRQGALRRRPGALPALHSPVGKEKGKPAYPGPLKNTGGGALANSGVIVREGGRSSNHSAVDVYWIARLRGQ